jgi:hypothetical protein
MEINPKNELNVCSNGTLFVPAAQFANDRTHK